MSTQHKNTGKLAMTIGILGFISGIILAFGENKFIGIFGSIASVGVAYKGYQDYKEFKNQK